MKKGGKNYRGNGEKNFGFWDGFLYVCIYNDILMRDDGGPILHF